MSLYPGKQDSEFPDQIELQGIVKTGPDSHGNSSVLIFIGLKASCHWI